MGQTSSQVAPTSAQATRIADLSAPSTTSSPKMSGVDDDIVYEHEDEIPVKKKRKISPGATRGGTKNSRKRKEAIALEDQAVILEHLVNGRVAPGEDSILEPGAKVKKSKKQRTKEAPRDHTVEDPSLASAKESTERVTTDANSPTRNGMNPTEHEVVEPGKTEGKKPKGRRSGLKFAPAKSPEAIKQPIDAVSGAEQPSDGAMSVPEVLEAWKKADARPPTRRRVSADDFQYKKRAKSAADTAGPQETDDIIPDSQPQEEVAKRRPRAKKQTVRSAPWNSSDPVDKQPPLDRQHVQSPGLAAEEPKHKRKDRSRRHDEDEPDLLPTPRATQARQPPSDVVGTEILNAPTPPTSVHGSGGLREDYEAFDATHEVAGWLDDQNHDEPAPSSAKKTKTKRKRVPRPHAGDGNDDEPARHEQAADQNRLSPRQGRREVDCSVQRSPELAVGIDQDTIAVPANEGGKKKRKSMSQDDVNVIDTVDSSEQPAAEQAVESTSLEPKPKKKKRKQAALADATNGHHANGEVSSTEQVTTQQTAQGATVTGGEVPRKKRKAPKKDLQSTSEHEDEERVSAVAGQTFDQGHAAKDDPAKGPFTDAEKRTVDGVFLQLRKETGKTDEEFRAVVMNWKEAADFKLAVQEALPRRPITSIRKFCLRRYHNLERGPWTEEQDNTLRNAQVTNPDKWTEISALVGRTAADCKDRWVQHLSLADNKQVGPWSQEEEAALIKAVDECISILKSENKKDKALIRDRAAMESMLSWKTVAQKVGGQRSAKKCNEKWHKMKRRVADNGAMQHVIASTGLDPANRSKKLREVETKYNQCDVGDLYDMLTEIYTAISNHSYNYSHESSLWAQIATANPNSRFKSAMRRRGFHDASDVYKDDVEMKGTIAASAKALADHLKAQWGIETLQAKRAFWPKDYARDETDIDLEPSAPQKMISGRAALKSPKKSKEPSRKIRSAARVEDSSEEEDTAAPALPKEPKTSTAKPALKSAARAKRSRKSTERVVDSDEEG